MTFKKWLESGKYLPTIMRDFHDQKDLFKAIHNNVKVEDHSYVKDVGWVTGQCYVIDIFLWTMAKRGYTLQKSRMNFEFEPIDEFIERGKPDYSIVNELLSGKDAK